MILLGRGIHSLSDNGFQSFLTGISLILAMDRCVLFADISIFLLDITYTCIYRLNNKSVVAKNHSANHQLHHRLVEMISMRSDNESFKDRVCHG